MNRSRAFRRHHTRRVALARERRYDRIFRRGDPGMSWALPLGKLRDTDRYFDCGKSRCYCCHDDKLLAAPRGHAAAVDQSLADWGEVPFNGVNWRRWTREGQSW